MNGKSYLTPHILPVVAAAIEPGPFSRYIPTSRRSAERACLHIGAGAVSRVVVTGSEHAALKFKFLALLKCILIFIRQTFTSIDTEIPIRLPSTRNPICFPIFFCHGTFDPMASVGLWWRGKLRDKAPHAETALHQ